MILAALLVAQVTLPLSPCKIEGVPGEVKCGGASARENRDAPLGGPARMVELSVIVLSALEPDKLPDPFLVMATQNPIESEGTYPLPEAQVDRFMLKVLIGYPEHDEELTIVQRQLEDAPELRQALSLDELKALQETVRQVYVDPSLISYAVDVATATRQPVDNLRDYVAYGVSPRGPISLVQAARALAVVRGRDYALVEDVQALTKDALRHRLVLTYQALAEGVTADSILESVLATVPLPQLDLGRMSAA